MYQGEVVGTFIYYKRKCISCLNKIVLKIRLPNPYSEAECPHCKGIVRIWP